VSREIIEQVSLVASDARRKDRLFPRTDGSFEALELCHHIGEAVQADAPSPWSDMLPFE